MALGGCAAGGATPFSAGRIDQRSSVAGEVAKASETPGPYPTFSSVPPVPHDIRPASAWRSAVVGELADKRQLEAEAASIPFILKDSEAWATAERAKIPASELKPVAPGEASDSEAYAAEQRARATPPPAPH